MEETLFGKTGIDEDAEKRAGPLLTTKQRFLQVLSEMGQPLHRQDLQSLAETDGLGEINPKSVGSLLSSMVREEIIIRVEEAVYTLPEFSGENYEKPQKVTHCDRLAEVFLAAARPLHLEEVRQLAESSDWEAADVCNTNSVVRRMFQQSQLVKLEKGVYSLPEFSSEEYELPEIPIGARLKAILAEARESLSAQEIGERAEKDGRGEFFKFDSVYGILHQMALRGEVVRTGRGLYCLPEFAEGEYSSPEATLGARMLDALWQAGRPLHKWEVHRLAEADGLGIINPGSLSTQFTRLVRRGLIVRLEPGIFALPEFAYASEEDAKTYAGKTEVFSNIVRIISEVGGSATLNYIYLALADSNLKVLSLKNIAGLLERMSQVSEQNRLIVRLKENTYCLLSVAAGEEYEAGPTSAKERLAKILQSAARPLHTQNIYRLAEKDERGAIKRSSVRAFLTQMTREELLVRVDAGVYSPPEFADRHYEIPEPTMYSRILEAFEEARRPLNVDQCKHLVNDDGQGKVKRISLHSELVQLTNSAVLIRLEPGIYSLPEFAEENYETQENKLEYRLAAIFKQARRPLDTQEIIYRTSEDGLGAFKSNSLHRALGWMKNEGMIVKTQLGVYSLPEFSGEEYEPFKMTTSARAMAALAKSARPLHILDIYRLANEDEEKEALGLPSLRAAVAVLTNEQRVVRLARGVYSLPEFTEKDYKLPRTTIGNRLEAVIREADGPLHWHEAHRRAEADGFGPMRRAGAELALSRMLKKGLVVRTSPGVYCLPESNNLNDGQ